MIAIFFMVELNGSEWMGMLCMKQRKIQTIFWGQKRMPVKKRTTCERNEFSI